MTAARALLGCVLVLGLPAGAAQGQVLLSTDTETELAHRVHLPNEVVQLILRSEPEDAQLFRECLAEQGLGSKAAAKLFSAQRIAGTADGLPDYFVRPALRPYCHVFYGAHLFRYWIVSRYRDRGRLKYKIIFHSGGDAVRVLAHSTNGHRDLELEGHNAVASDTSTWRFDGRQYVATGCIRRRFDTDGEGPCD